jgi:transposase
MGAVPVRQVTSEEAVMGEITTVGIDLAKNAFSVHGVDGHGKTVLRKTVSRGKLIELMAQLPRCLVGMEACSGAHQLARDLQPLGHEPRIVMPRFILRYAPEAWQRHPRGATAAPAGMP